MRTLIRRIFEKASFHGFAYIPRRDIHCLERLLWSIVLISATYCSIAICWNQWERYKVNPTVLGVERVFGTKPFPYMGVTVCSNYFDEERAEVIIKKNWNSIPGDEKFNYYMEFLLTLNKVRYKSFEALQLYKNDASLSKVEFLDILWEIRSTLYMNVTDNEGQVQEIGSIVQYGFNGHEEPRFHSVITEVGMCETTSLLHEYQNPTGFQREPKLSAFREMCSPFNACVLKVAPSIRDGDKADIYVHHIEDIVPHDDKFVIHREVTENMKTDVDVNLELISAEDEVRNVPIKYRKCRFNDENNLRFFQTYSPSLCRNECRIKAALRLCKCKPFFYVVGDGPVCSVKGMLCLDKANWQNSTCDECLPLCSLLTYTALKTIQINYSIAKFETTVTITLTLPKMGLRRIVVFSIDQLVVAFGGAASLFLGCSFLSFAQIIFYCIQSFEEKFSRWFCKKNK